MATAFRAFLLTLLALQALTCRAEVELGDQATDIQRDEKQIPQEDTELLDHFGGLPKPPKLPPPKGLKQMAKPNRTWIDLKKREVVIDGYISLREGMLEMFACPVGTKEHESVIAVYSWAQVAHAALLAVGAEKGTPVSFRPKFQPPTGMEIEIEIRWLDEKKKWRSARAQDWIRNARTGKPMSHPWVFAGSGFWKDEDSGREYYMGDSGDFICVSNFSTATLDIPVESSQMAGGLVYEPLTENIPPLGTPVRLVLKPQFEKGERAQTSEKRAEHKGGSGTKKEEKPKSSQAEQAQD